MGSFITHSAQHQCSLILKTAIQGNHRGSEIHRGHRDSQIHEELISHGHHLFGDLAKKFISVISAVLCAFVVALAFFYCEV